LYRLRQLLQLLLLLQQQQRLRRELETQSIPYLYYYNSTSSGCLHKIHRLRKEQTGETFKAHNSLARHSTLPKTNSNRNSSEQARRKTDEREEKEERQGARGWMKKQRSWRMDEITEEPEDGETQEREEGVDEWRKKQRSQRMEKHRNETSERMDG
jgi:hypothetical protein